MTKSTELASLPEMLNELIDELIIYETWSLAQLGLKLAEETGELAEHIFVADGLKNKELDEPMECEVADVINCAIAVLVRKMVLEGAGPDEIKQRLMSGIETKNKKYLRLLVPNNPKKSQPVQDGIILVHSRRVDDAAHKVVYFGTITFNQVHCSWILVQDALGEIINYAIDYADSEFVIEQLDRILTATEEF
jgi:NTP pyrophosphatase (non-canonical NTP hydrolase)